MSTAVGFKFVEAYRIADPLATREIVAAREEAFKVIKPEVKTIARVHDLCRLAFHLPVDAEVYAGWFDTPIGQKDPHFVMSQDVAEAGRMATMILRDLISTENDQVAMSVLAASFAGRRAAFDKGGLVNDARDCISQSARRAKLRAPSGDLIAPQIKGINEHLQASDSGATPPAIKALIEDIRLQITESMRVVNGAYLALREDTIRLADEVDLLWSHIGDWSNLLEIPRNALSAESLPMVCGIELGAMVRELPGPYGVYGIIERILGKAAQQSMAIEECIVGLEAPQIARLACERSPDIFPLHKLLALAAKGDDWSKAFGAVCPDVTNVKLSQAEIATQAYRERTSLVSAGLDQ